MVFFIGPELAALVALTVPDFEVDVLDLDFVKEILEVEERVVTPDMISKKQDNKQMKGTECWT